MIHNQNNNEGAIRLLIVDDSSFIRSALKSIFKSTDKIIVVGEATNGKEGVEMAGKLRPDVITMDVEMPIMNGIEATKEITKTYKIPVIMLSTLTEDGTIATLDALYSGAVDFISKNNTHGEFNNLKDEIIGKIIDIHSSTNLKNLVHRQQLLRENKNDNHATLNSKLTKYTIEQKDSNPLQRLNLKDKSNLISNSEKLSPNKNLKLSERIALLKKSQKESNHSGAENAEQNPTDKNSDTNNSSNTNRNFSILTTYNRTTLLGDGPYKKPNFLPKALFIGISTGGPAALQKLLPLLNGKINIPIFIVQHMPPNFTKSLSERLDSISQMKVREAASDINIESNIYIAKGGFQMLVKKNKIVLDDKKDENVAFMPSVNITLDSLINYYDNKIVAIMMTGMGNDGSTSFKRLYDKGGFIVVQDFESCIVAGMPKSVIELNCFNEIVKFDDMASYINSIF